MKTINKRIQELKLRASPINLSGSYVDDSGTLQMVDLKINVTDEDRKVRGYLIIWGVRDTYGTAFIKGCCSKSIRERGPESDSKQKIAFLWMHDTCNPIGRFTELKEDKYGLYFEAEVDEIPEGDRALRQIRSGTINQFSVGFDYIWDKVEYDEESDSIMLLEIMLMEGSPVTFGSNAETYAIRTPDQLVIDKENLIADTDDFLKTLPRNKQLELRQLITRHTSLARIKPDELDQVRTLEKNVEPNKDSVEIAGYKLNINEFLK